jgi:formylmethanofuran--tetrahydromethanopterin N-formyltransferase
MQQLTRNGVLIDDTFAEAFGMRATAIIITAPTLKWARQAATTMTGYATSVIGCGCEAAIDMDVPETKTPDGRPGCRVMIFAMGTDELQKQLKSRLGQCVLTSPGSACFAGLEGTAPLDLGNSLRYFGDGWQISKKFGGRHYWRVPVMDGEFLCEATTGLINSALTPDVNAVLEIVIDGETSDAVAAAMRAGLKAVIDLGPKKGALRVSAGNYGGKLGKFHYHLKDLLP